MIDILPRKSVEPLADQLVQYANNKGLWPTIDFMVKRWIEKNPEYFFVMKGAILDERKELQDSYGSNEMTRGKNLPMRRVAEVPERIWILIDKLFAVEKRQYVGGEKQFWRDFSKRYPIFSIGKPV